MSLFSIADILPLKNKEIISFLGAGGKTSFLMRLASELASQDKKVIVTTTTKMHCPGEIPLVLEKNRSRALEGIRECFKKGNIAALGSSLTADNKIEGADLFLLEELFNSGIESYILVEADGAAKRSIKAHAPYEPLLPPSSGIVIPIIGADILGKSFDERNVHRPRLFSRITGAVQGKPVTLDHIVDSMRFMVELSSMLAPGSCVIPVINKAELIKDVKLVRHISKVWARMPRVLGVLFTSLTDKAPVKFVFRSSSRPFVSCVILAAGMSSRMGSDKLQLEIGGQRILERSVNNAHLSAADEVIVVTRPQSRWEEIFQPYGSVRVVYNPDFKKGISSSVKTGIEALHPFSQAVVFALGDQPFIPPSLYDELIKNYLRYLPLSVVPYFQGQRGNPVIFDRRCWPQIMELEGDKGGSQIFPYLTPRDIVKVNTSSPEVLQDLDTPADLPYNDKS